MESLPPQQAGTLIVVLWINAVVTLALQAAQLGLVVRTLRRARHPDHPIATIVDCAASLSTAIVVSASALHKLAWESFVRELEHRARAV